MGAIVALLYGAGLSPDDIQALFEDFPAASLFDVIFPTAGGFLDQARFMATLRAMVGDLDLADLPIPVMILCDDLPTRRQVRVASGDFVEVMAAAFALPGVFAPIRSGDLALIDGGVTNLVPVEAAYAYGRRVVAATALYGKQFDYRSAFVVLNRAIDVGKTRKSVEELLARRPPVIRCDVEDLSYMKFSSPAEVARRGYDSARAAMGDVVAVAGPPRPLTPALAQARVAYHRRLAALAAAARRGASFPPPPGYAVKPALRFADEAGGWRGPLGGRRFAGAEAELRGGPAALSLAALAGIEDDADRAWGASAAVALRQDVGAAYARGELAGAALELRAAALLSGALAGEAPEPRELVAAARAAAGLGPFGGLVARPFGEAEADAALPSWDWTRWAVEAGIELESAGRADAFLAPAFFVDSEDNRGPAAEARLAIALGRSAAFRLRGAGRAALDGPGVGKEAATGFRGASLDGRAPSRAYGGAELALLGTSLELDLEEMLIMERPELGLYSELDYAGPLPGRSGEAELRPVVGLSLSLDVSLLGLSPLGLTGFAACATDGSGWAFGLRTGHYFR